MRIKLYVKVCINGKVECNLEYIDSSTFLVSNVFIRENEIFQYLWIKIVVERIHFPPSVISNLAGFNVVQLRCWQTMTHSPNPAAACFYK